jgi:membrane-associated protein
VAFLQWVLDTLRDPGEIIRWGGYPALTAVIFLETGAMVFFLPGDSLLFVAGLYAGKGDLDLWLLMALLIPAAILGDATSYVIGKRTGAALFTRPESRFFKPAYAEAARRFYEKHGGKAIVLARFMPLVRTFVPVVAGVARMRYRDFAVYNVVGAVLWIVSMTLLGNLLGQFEWVGKNIEKFIVGIVLVSVAPGFLEWLKHRRRARALVARASAVDEAALDEAGPGLVVSGDGAGGPSPESAAGDLPPTRT